MFEYDKTNLLDHTIISTQPEDDFTRKFLYNRTSADVLRVAEVIVPDGDAPFPTVLFVHWYEPEACDSNRKQFVSEAEALAKDGIASMMVETMWSDIDWFYKRTQADDLQNSLNQVIELRQAMDILHQEVVIDSTRFAYVGHDFGAMYGVLMGSIDPRPTHYVLMAGTPRFSDWYLYFPRLEGEERQAFIEQMTQIDPINHIAKLAPAPIYFQFGNDDFHVPEDRIQEFFASASDPKQLRIYEAGHGLNNQAKIERLAWLRKHLIRS